MTDIRRLAVLEHGEAAVRVLNAVRDVGDAFDEPPVTVLAHDEPDAHPWFGREADELVSLADEAVGSIDDVVSVLSRSKIDGVWVGAGPQGIDRVELIEACDRAGIAIVGPSAAAIDRIERAAADAATGGDRSDDLRQLVEIDVLADHHGGVWCLGGRDVSVRRDGLTLLAEAPCAGVDQQLGDRMRNAAVELAAAADYRGACVVSFAHDGDRCELVGVDVAAVPDHATTEERTGRSLIGERVRVAVGQALASEPPTGDGVAVEARLVALDLCGGDPVAPTEIELLSFPVGTGVRIDANRRPGDVVSGRDPVIAVFTAWGPDRATAIDRLRRAVERSSVVLTDGVTNRTELLAMLRHPELVAGPVDVGWLDRVTGWLSAVPASPVAVLTAAVEAYEADASLAQRAFFAAAENGRPVHPPDVGDGIELAYRGIGYEVSVDRIGPSAYTVRHDDLVAELAVDRLDAFERRITCGGRRHRVVVSPTGTGFRLEIDGAAHTVERDDGEVIRAGWPALVVDVPVELGQTVAVGEPIVVLESMKMETVVPAPFAGEVTAVSVSPNVQIERGAPLLRLRAAARHDDGDRSPIDLSGCEQQIDFDRKPCDRVYEPLGNHLLGFDLEPDVLRRLLVQQRRLAEIADPADVDLLACEDGLLDIVADLAALSRPQSELDFIGDAATAGSRRESNQEYLIAFMQWLDAERAGLPPSYQERLVRALGRYGVHGLERSEQLEAALMRLHRSFERLTELRGVVIAILRRRLAHRDDLLPVLGDDAAVRLDRLAAAAQGRHQAIADLARDVRFHFFDEPPMEAAAAATLGEVADDIEHLVAGGFDDDRSDRVDRLVACPQPLRGELMRQWRLADGEDDHTGASRREVAAEIYLRRFFRRRALSAIRYHEVGGHRFTSVEATATDGSDDVLVVMSFLPTDDIPSFAHALAGHLAQIDPGRPVVVDLVTWREGDVPDIDETSALVDELLASSDFGRPLERLDVTVTSDGGVAAEHLRTQIVVFRQAVDGEWNEDRLYRNLHPMLAERLELWRLANFELERRPSPEDIHLFLGVAHENPADRRLFALAEVRELDVFTEPASGVARYRRLERTGLLALAAMRTELERHQGRDRPVANRLVLDVFPPWNVPEADLEALTARFAPLARRVGLEKVVLKIRRSDRAAPDGLRSSVLHIEQVGSAVLVREERAGDRPVKSLTSYQQKVLTAARFGVPYPYEIVRLLTDRGRAASAQADSFVELELEPGTAADGSDDRLVPVDRPPAENSAHVVVGLVTNHTDVVPEGMQRIALLSDPTQGLGNLAEPECRRINATLAYALEHRIPVEWFAVSSGALIAMDSGTENMDWIALTLRRLIEFTQAGGEVNIVVTGINVGGQPYWNAEATMLNHTKGILVMSPASTMVLTGKQALDYSGAVSADDNQGIGGYDHVMGPNGQAQYWAPTFPAACDLLLRHYELTYVVPGERFPRRRPTADPVTRDVRSSAHAELVDSPFRTIGDLFSNELNPERKQPFDMRSVMRAVADTDSEPLERWQDLRDGDTSIVWDTSVGGIPVCLLGLESHTVRRRGFVPADGPPAWTSGTLFPHSSRKTARAINAASGGRPLVVLANLSGFDGSPESMRRRQLEFGAEIGRAVTNFDGPIVFVVVSRYHGGAFVVFSKALNASMEIAAVEGSYASVIGGAPAAATVFAREVKQRTQRDERVVAASAAVADASGVDVAARRAELVDVTARVRSEKLGEVAAEFDAVHTIERARQVGSVDRIIPAAELRPYVIDALERRMAAAEHR